MKFVTVLSCLFLSFFATAQGQDISAALHDPTGAVADSALSSAYAFPSTAQGGASSIVVRLKNTSTHPISVSNVYVGSSAGSPTLSSAFTVNGVTLNKTLAAGGLNFEDFTLSFTPSAIAGATGYLQATYQIQENGCSFTSTDPTTQCVSQTVPLSTVSGTGIAPQWLLSVLRDGASTPLLPSSSTPFDFGNISTSNKSSFTFTIANTTNAAIPTPVVSLVTAIFGSTAFALDTSALPSTLTAFGTGSFTVTFQPGQVGLTSATLQVATLTYPISGTGIVVADIDALQISYTDSTGVRTLPQAATPIDFGQIIPGAASSGTLTFVLANPATSYDAITVPSVTITGAGFVLAGLPKFPASIAPGSSITFKASFTPTSSGNYTGVLAIGSRAFNLKGLGVASSLPDITMQVDQSPLLSNLQAHLSIVLSKASTVQAIGTLTMAFKPSDANVSDDAAILFLGNSGRVMQVDVASGASNATYDGSSAISFQSGTTAGTITFTLTFADRAPLMQTFTITPAQISITGATAVRKDPNLIVTLTGFDNTYSAGPMTFTFFDTAGKAITATPISVNAASDFHNYFFGPSNTAGGSFSVQAVFPVTGGVANVGSVTATLSNSSGTATTSQQLQ